LLGEAVGVALAGIDGNRGRTCECPSARDPATRVSATGGLLGLPEDRLAALHLREDELRAGKARTVEHEIDRRAAPATRDDRCLLDELGLFGPGPLEAVAVDTRGRRPRLACFQHQPALERKHEQIWQLAVCVWVPGDDEDPSAVAHAAAA
jgi:hypothetical protein